MNDFSRTLGFMNCAAGVALLLVPGTVRGIMEARAEYARLSDKALRLLGVWSLLAGLALVTISHSHAGHGMGEVISRGRSAVL